MPVELGPTLPTLVTERLCIRAIDAADAPALFEIFSDPEVTRYWSSPPLPDLAAARALADDIAECVRTRTLLQWGITRRGETRVVGTCTLAAWNQQHRRAEIGFALHRGEWGQGLIAEAGTAVLAFGFDALDLHRIEADVDPRNAASIRLLERWGFQREGLLRERYLQSGELQDALFLGLLRREWHARQDPALRPA